MSLKKNIISNFILSSLSVIFPLITFPYITRILSPESLGKIFLIDAFVGYFILFSAVGIPYYGVREISKLNNDRPAISKFVSELVIIQLCLSIICSGVFYSIHFFLPSLADSSALVKIGCLYIIISSFIMEWFYQGIESFSFIALRSIIIKLASVISILLFIKSSEDVILYYFILTTVTLLQAIINYSNYWLHFHVPVLNKLQFSKHFKPLLILFSINVSISVYTILDTIILGLFSSSQSVSYYAVPLKLVKMFWTIVSGVGIVLIPRISNLYGNSDFDKIKNLMTKSFSIAFLLTIPFSYFCFFFSAEILTLISGSNYLPSVNALKILSVVPLIIASCNILGSQFLLPIGKEKIILYATILGLIVSLILNFLLIPRFSFLGSSIACVASESCVCIYIYIFTKKYISFTIDSLLLKHIIIALVCTYLLTTCCSAYIRGIQSLFLACAIYIASFVVLQFMVFKNAFVFSLLKMRKR